MVIKMVKVLFVCLGNICRSPMAEGLFRKRVIDEGLEDLILIESRATSSWEIGNKPHLRTEKILREHGAYFSDMKVSKITEQDFDDFDYIIGMDHQNIKDLKEIAKNHKHKVFLYLEVLEDKDYINVEDPYYTGRYNETYELIVKAIDSWMDIFKKSLS